MVKIEIKDLPKDMSITEEEFRWIMGGFNPQPEPPASIRFRYPRMEPLDEPFRLKRKPFPYF
jgi:hypothetical protein